MARFAATIRYTVGMTEGAIKKFQSVVLEHYALHGRHDLPWRTVKANGSFDSYKILVSEIMLQQTQVPRVIPKFGEFVARFPTTDTLAVAELGDVLRVWNGLGYNRRAKYLWQAARAIVQEHGGRIPDERGALERLPGIGPNTAGAVLAYAYNQPTVFIETNIRTVFIHHFFAGREKVPDKAITDLAARTLPDNPRIWYWALMDYGTYLKQTVGNKNRASTAYARQSAFHGSRRQVRGRILRLLSEKPMARDELQAVVADERVPGVLDDLTQEALIAKQGSVNQHGTKQPVSSFPARRTSLAGSAEPSTRSR